MEAFVAGIGLRGPGLPGWQASRAVLTGSAPYAPAPIEVPPPTILAANERRRAGLVTRLALCVAQEAAEMSGLPPAALRSVFASGNGDGAVIHAILDALARPDGAVSPTQFHNSVHNAPAGYWSIGAGATQAATCLGCHDDSAAAGLLKAVAEARAERSPVLLCAYDVPPPPPLGACHRQDFPFGVALVLTPDRSAASLARLRVAYDAEPPPPDGHAPRHPALAALPGGNPVARLLCLLEAIAAPRAGRLSLALQGGRVDVDVDGHVEGDGTR